MMLTELIPQVAKLRYLKTGTLKLSQCDYSDVYIIVNWTMKVAEEKQLDKIRVIFKNCASFTDGIRKPNITLVK